MGLAAILGNGVDLSSIDFELKDDMQTFMVEGKGVPEMQDAHAMLPAIIEYRNPIIWDSLTSALKSILIQRDCDKSGCPILSGTGKLPAKATTKHPLRLDQLGLWVDKYDDNGRKRPVDFIMIHKVPFDPSRVETTVPAFVAICFFLEDVNQGVKARGSFFRRLPGLSPRGGGGGGPPGPPSSHSSNKRSRGGGGTPSSIHTIQMSTGGGRGGGDGGRQGMQVDTNPSPLSNMGAYMSPMADDPLANPLNQPSPDQQSSGGFFSFGLPRTRRRSNNLN